MPRSIKHALAACAAPAARAQGTAAQAPADEKSARGMLLLARGDVTGRVRLRAVLGADGLVRHVVPVRRLPAGLTGRCIEVARRIRFTPATANGTPVSQFVTIEYNFKIY